MIAAMWMPTRTPALSSRAIAIANPTHIYILGFSDGIVKVGRTSQPEKRIKTLGYEGRRRGAEITDQWLVEHPDPRRAEWYLRLVGRGFFESLSAEYFRAEFEPFVAKVCEKFDDYGVWLPERPASRAS